MANDFDRLTSLEAAQSRTIQTTGATADAAPQTSPQISPQPLSQTTLEITELETTDLRNPGWAGEMARVSREQAAWARLMSAWSRTGVRHRRSTRKGPPAFSN